MSAWKPIAITGDCTVTVLNHDYSLWQWIPGGVAAEGGIWRQLEPPPAFRDSPSPTTSATTLPFDPFSYRV